MNDSLKVISINIEYDRHLDRVLPFVQRESPDVLLLNELLEKDIPLFEGVMSGQCSFAPSMYDVSSKGRIPLGSGICTAFPVEVEVTDYAGNMGALANLDLTSSEAKSQTWKHSLVLANIQKDNTAFQLGLTHFIWTPDGQPDDLQRKGMSNLLALLTQKGEMALFGDFNAPRGGEIFAMLAERFKDNIPLKYETSLDENLHRVGREKFREEDMHVYMVDGCFTTPSYTASSVRLEFGVSDHAAVVANIERTAL